MLIACVCKGDKYSDEYVLKLQRMVGRHLDGERHEFLCLTDRDIPGVLCQRLEHNLPGWWSKLEVFKLGEPTLYLDLDVVITGSLKPVLDAWDGAGFIKDWWLPGFNSSVMRLTGDERHVFDNFTPADMRRCYMGDQQWITEQMPDAKTFPAEWFPSLKANKCFEEVPSEAIAVILHGNPKPHEFESGWVKQLWA